MIRESHSSSDSYMTYDLRVIEILEKAGHTIVPDTTSGWFFVKPGFIVDHGKPMKFGDSYITNYGSEYQCTNQNGDRPLLPNKFFIDCYFIHDQRSLSILQENGYVYRHIEGERYYCQFKFSEQNDRFVLHKNGKDIVLGWSNRGSLVVADGYALKRYMTPSIGDEERIRPLVDLESIHLIEGFYCLPVFCYSSNEVKIYMTKNIGGIIQSHELIENLAKAIPDGDFSQYDAVLSTERQKEGEPYFRRKLHVKVEPITTSVTIRYPTRGDMKIAINNMK